VAALYDLGPTRVQQVAAECGAAKVFEDLAQLSTDQTAGCAR
jgi:predicted dehydrogenase